MVRSMTASGTNPGRLPQNALATLLELQRRRDGCGQLDELVIEKGDARLEAPAHGHVVDPLTGSSMSMTVVSLRRAASSAESAPGLANCPLTNSNGWSSGSEPFVADQLPERAVTAIEEDLGVSFRGVVPLHRRRGGSSRPAEDLIGALTRLDHLHVAGHLFGQQEERHAIMAPLARSSPSRRRQSPGADGSC